MIFCTLMIGYKLFWLPRILFNVRTNMLTILYVVTEAKKINFVRLKIYVQINLFILLIKI